MVREAVIVADIETGRIQLWNPAAETIFGYTPEEIVGEPIDRLIPPEFRERHRAGLERLRTTGQGQIVDSGLSLELPALHRSGSRLTVDLSLSRIEDPAQPPRHVLAIVRDVTERREAAERQAELVREQVARAAAEASQRRLAELTEALDRALAEARLLNAIQTAAAGEEDLGRILASALGHLGQILNFTGGSIALIEGDELAIVAAIGPFAETALGQRLPRGKGRAWRLIERSESWLSNDLTADGVRATTPIRSYLAAPLIGRGRPFGLLEVDSTLTNAFTETDLAILEKVARALSGPIELARRYAAEVAAVAEAEAAQRRLILLADASAALVASIEYRSTVAGVARLIVPTLAERCQIDLVETDGSVIRIVADRNGASVEDTEYAHLPAVTRRVIETGRAVHGAGDPDADVPVAGTMAEPPIEATWLRVPIVARGQTFGAITLDTGPGGRYEVRDLALVEDVAGRVALAIDNARLYQAAQAAVTLRNEFLSTVSHDLKSPLTGIKGLAQVLRRQIARPDGLDPTRLADGLERIDGLTSRMTEQINELLDVARLEIGQPVDLDRRTTDLISLARQAATEMDQTSPNHEIKLETSENALIGTWDAVRLRRVIDNLLSNAVKYSPRGGAITVRVWRDTTKDGDRAALSVTDRGIGIPAADLGRVFETYHRARNVKGRIAGTGIGLAGSRRIVEQHGGTIAVASQEGHGSTFTVRLPFEPPAE